MRFVTSFCLRFCGQEVIFPPPLTTFENLEVEYLGESFRLIR